MANLPDDYREVLVLREIEDMDYREIATVTNVPIGTVMSRLARARAALKKHWLRQTARESLVQCPESLRVQAYFDGELDAVRPPMSSGTSNTAPSAVRCIATSTICATRCVATCRFEQTPPALRARVTRALDGERPDARAPAAAGRPPGVRGRSGSASLSASALPPPQPQLALSLIVTPAADEPGGRRAAWART